MKELDSISRKAKLLKEVLKSGDIKYITEVLNKMLNTTKILYKSRDEYREKFPDPNSSDESRIKASVNLIMEKSK